MNRKSRFSACFTIATLAFTLIAAPAVLAEVPEEGWHAEVMTSDGTSIHNEGETVWAWAGGGSAYNVIGEISVNGVTFSTVKSLGNKPSGLTMPFSINHSLSMDGSNWGDEGVSDAGYAQMLGNCWWRDGYGTDGLTYTLNDLEVGEKYLVQAVFHRTNYSSYQISNSGCDDTITLGGTGWTYGGSFVGVFTATASQYAFTIKTSSANYQQLNALQLRKIVATGPIAPSVGSVSAKGGMKAKVTLADIIKGTNDDGSEKATSYSVFYRLGTGDTVTALTGQAGTSATFNITGLEDGVYTVSTWITTDKGRSTEAQSATFTIDTTQPSWTATPMSATGDTILTDGTLVYAYGHYDSTGSRTVNGVTFETYYNIDSIPGKVVSTTPKLCYAGNGFGSMSVEGDYGQMLKYGFWYNNSSPTDITYTLSGLEKGADYIVQIVVHRKDNDYKVTAPDEETFIQVGKDGTWKYGGSLSCEFTATNTVHSFVLNYEGYSILNAIQVRKVKDAPLPVIDPSIGSASVKAKGTKATVTLSDVVMGTDATGIAATQYAINWSLTGQAERQGVLADQTEEEVSFEIPDLADGDYTCSVTITTDKGKTSAAREVDFTVYSSVGDFDALKNSIEQAKAGDTVVIAKGIYYATEPIVVSNAIRIVSAEGKVRTIVDGGYPENAFVLFDVTSEGVKVSGLTFRNSGESAISVHGAVHGFEAIDCSFENCHGSSGGGIDADMNYNKYDAQSADAFPARGSLGVVSGCQFVDCEAVETSNGGGGVCGSFWIENSTFDNCSAARYAPAIYTDANMMISNCVFRNIPRPAAGERAAIYQNRTKVSLKILDCQFDTVACPSFGGASGAVVFADRCDLNDCSGSTTLNDNELISLTYNIAIVRNTLIHGNRNPFNLVSALFQNCTIVDNVGGFCIKIRAGNNLPNASFTNCVFAGNEAWRNASYSKGGAGISWHGASAAANDYTNLVFASSILQGGSDSESGLNVLLALDATGRTEALTAKADARGVLFKDAAAGDWTAKSTRSPMVNGGAWCDWMTDATDLNGQPRVIGSDPDVGCYEYRAKGLLMLLR